MNVKILITQLKQRVNKVHMKVFCISFAGARKLEILNGYKSKIPLVRRDS